MSRKRELAAAVEATRPDEPAAVPLLPEAIEPRRGRGRPPGAKNRRTVEMLEWLEKGLGASPPLQRMAEIIGTGDVDWLEQVRAIARALGCSRLEAFDRYVRVLADAAPYWHQRLPQAVDVQSRGVAAVYMVSPGVEPGMAVDQAAALPAPSAAQMAAAIGLTFAQEDIVLDQSLSKGSGEDVSRKLSDRVLDQRS